jgi:exonuclease VII small subunit
MTIITQTLSKIAERLGLSQPLLARAQRRYLANRKRAFIAHNKQVQAQKAADKARGKRDLVEAARQDRIAARCGARASKNHARALHFLGAVKHFQQTINDLETTQTALEAKLKAYKKAHGVSIRGNKVIGGTPEQRLVACSLKSAANCADGTRANFYSQAGAWDVAHCITGEHYGERSDCSSWFTSNYKSCGLSDPNASDFGSGYTGTLVAHGHQIDRPVPGCAVIYGPGVGHHVEMYVGPGDRTIGHGSAPVDAGVVDLFGDHDYRFFTYA